jgi:WD40 repeat protein
MTANASWFALDLSFSPDGQSLAVAQSKGPPLSIWNWRSGQQLKTLAHAGRAETLYWSRQGVLVGADGGFTVWDPQTGQLVKTLDAQPPSDRSPSQLQLPLGPTDLSADRTTLAAYIPRFGVRVWRVD